MNVVQRITKLASNGNLICTFQCIHHNLTTLPIRKSCIAKVNSIFTYYCLNHKQVEENPSAETYAQP